MQFLGGGGDGAGDEGGVEDAQRWVLGVNVQGVVVLGVVGPDAGNVGLVVGAVGKGDVLLEGLFGREDPQEGGRVGRRVDAELVPCVAVLGRLGCEIGADGFENVGRGGGAADAVGDGGVALGRRRRGCSLGV